MTSLELVGTALVDQFAAVFQSVEEDPSHVAVCEKEVFTIININNTIRNISK